MSFTFPPLTMVMKNKKKGGNEDPTNGWCDEIKQKKEGIFAPLVNYCDKVRKTKGKELHSPHLLLR